MGRRLGASIAVAVLVLVGSSVLAAPAAVAQTQQVFSCTYTVGPTTLPPGGGFVTVSGTAPGASVVRVFANGVLAAVTNSAQGTGAFSAQVFLTASVEISVALDDYPNTPCIGVGGSEVGQGTGTGAGTGLNATGASGLARTGASNTGGVVRLGLASLGLGLVLVIAARRRAGVRGRV